ncbi:MAG: DUF4294 domain-containing protein [Bacteroidota bacterium]|nr:DUF4294 domain-containing protein [Bacteroidota bacterium]
MDHSTRIILIAFALVSCCCTAWGQSPVPGHVLEAVVIDGDTIPMVTLHEVRIDGRWRPKSRHEEKQYDKLTRNVVKVYPYARITRELLSEYENDLTRIDREGDQELYVKLAEAELRAEFEAEVKDLTMSQGKVLVKLIDRETGRSSYSLVQDLKGSFNAVIWQGMARLFGQDLKAKYDPIGEDLMIEVIVQRIENGELAVSNRTARTEKAQARLEKRKARLYRKYGLNEGEISLQ